MATILKKKNTIKFPETWANVILALERTGYTYSFEENRYIIVSDLATNRNLVITLYEQEPDKENASPLMKDGETLNPIIEVAEIQGKEDMLWRFTIEYYNIDSEVVFWNNEIWYYTVEEMKKLYEMEYNDNWCYHYLINQDYNTENYIRF